MKKMQIFEPAMCCPTGICGVGVNPELIRISAVLDNLSKNNIKVERFNLTNAPQAFVTNDVVNHYIKAQGVEGLPIVVLDGEVIITGRYPTNDELVTYLQIPIFFLGEENPKKEEPNKSSGCSCSGSDCC